MSCDIYCPALFLSASPIIIVSVLFHARKTNVINNITNAAVNNVHIQYTQIQYIYIE